MVTRAPESTDAQRSFTIEKKEKANARNMGLEANPAPLSAHLADFLLYPAPAIHYQAIVKKRHEEIMRKEYQACVDQA